MSDDLKRLQGIWYVVSLTMDGRSLPSAGFAGARISIDRDRFVSAAMGAEYGGTIQVHSASCPKGFDLIFDAGPEAGNRNGGIYELDEEAWRICLNTRGAARPESFDAAPGTGIVLEVLHRNPPVAAEAAPAS